MKTPLLFVLCWLTVQAVRADDVIPSLTVDGVTYSNVTVGTVTPTKVGIIYSGGIASLPLEKLSPELQKRFGYDPQKAEQHRQTEAQRQAAWQKAEQERMAQQAIEQAKAEKCTGSLEFVATVVQVIPEGLLLRVTAGGNGFFLAKNDPPLDWVLIGHPQHDTLAESNVVRGSAYRDGVFRYTTVLGASRTVERWVCCTDILKSQTQKPADPFVRPKQRDPNIRRIGESP